MPVAAAIIPAVVGAGASIIGANKQASATKAAAAATETRPFSGTSAYGTTNFNQGTRQFDINQANNPFASLFTVGGLSSLANAASAPGSPFYGAPPELIAALGQAGNSDAEAADRLNLLRSQAAPENNAAALSLKDKLFSLGQLGSTSGAAGQEALLRAANAQDLGFQTTAADWANQRAQQRFQNALTTIQTGGNLSNQQFGQGVTSNNALGDMFQRLLSQAGLGVSAGGGQAPQAALASAQASQVPFQAISNIAVPALGSLATGFGNKLQGLTWGGDLPQIQMPAYAPGG